MQTNEQIVREFFTDSEWDLIFDLLDSNRQFDDSEDYHEDYLTAIKKIRTLFSWLIMNRSELQDALIQQILDDMDIKTMMSILYDNMSESYDKYSDEELTEECKEYYPELLEGWCWDR